MYIIIAPGDSASVYNLKNTIELYSFDLLHICSHGGDIGGTKCEVDFIGNDGSQHTIEFDHVLTVALTPYVDKHAVESIYYFKKLDGLPWQSKELKELKYPNELYASLLPEISRAFDQKKVRRKSKVDKVTNANAIHCKAFNYLANFDQVGNGNCPPVVFNNTCYSWMNVFTSFLVGGVRGYIGTLKSVDNNAAVRFAETFYDNVFDHNIFDALYTARISAIGEGNDTYHIYWGLHFSTLNNQETAATNRRKIIHHLVDALAQWKSKLAHKEGSPDLLAGKVTDTQWLLKNVLGSAITGHEPSDFN